MNLPLGYRYAATYAGIRKDHRDDLGLIVSDTVASGAAVATMNRVQAAPVRLAREHLRASRGKVGAILVNAGNANCATRSGDDVALKSCKAVASALGIPANQVIPASTGVIGVEMDASLVVGAAPRLVTDLSESQFPDVAAAIMTTDTVPKTAFGEVTLRDGECRIAGMTKGSGMINPNMATTLGFLMTDAVLAPVHLQRMLSRCAERTYNRLSVDGETSTNDIVVLLANGASGVRPTEKERLHFEEVLCTVMEDLSEQIARDGEGAKKLVTIRVLGAQDEESAGKVARSIANSLLVKTAIAGCDPNWGRILAAAGNSGVAFEPSQVDIYMQGTLVCSGGLAADFPERELKAKLDDHEVMIRVCFRGPGTGESRFWTCDLTEGYVRINGSYRT